MAPSVRGKCKTAILSTRMKNTTLMAHLSWDEYAERIEQGAVVLIPVGAVEQHGYHLPLAVDYLLAEAISKLVAEQCNALVAPAVIYGYKSQPRTGGGCHFPGSAGLDGHTLSTLLLDVMRELVRHGAKKLAVIDGHYENQMFITEACDLAIREFRRDGKNDVKIVQARYFEQADETIIGRHLPGLTLDMAYEHGGVFETSALLHLYPGLVSMDKAKPQVFKSFPSYDCHPPRRDWIPESGSLSDPTKATAELGKDIVEDCVAGLIQILKTEFSDA